METFGGYKTSLKKGRKKGKACVTKKKWKGENIFRYAGGYEKRLK